ncbi:MAG: TRAP transporter large permease subunit [Deltaproteobacteria bacterium]|nr:TRAP transporter large permease subunit [Deltaproteobacteria bacterium]
MDFNTAAVVCVLGMLILMTIGLPVVYSLMLSSVVVGLLTYGPGTLEKVGFTTFNTLYTMSWTPLPLFILMACVLAETRIGEDLFDTARNWMSRVPGGLISAGILGQAAMSAAVGTSLACLLAMGKVAEPEFRRYGYNKAFAMGGLCCGGVLGPLIPPSTAMIIYSVLSDTSLGHLFMAGMVPGILLAIMLGSVPIIICSRNPSLGPPLGKVKWSKRFSSLKKIWPVIAVMISILGSIYLGIATPTEAAGVGSVVVVIISVCFFGLRLKELHRALVETAILSSMVLFMIVGAWLFSYVIGSSGLAKTLANYVLSIGMSKWWVIISINLLLLILGCFIDSVTIMMLTVPLFTPVITEFGFSPVWFGILYVVNVQIGLITPPMGLELFVVRSTFDIPVDKVIKGTIPYMIVLFIFLAIIIAFPQISLWLPSMMKG